MAANSITMKVPPLSCKTQYVSYSSTDVSGCEELLAAESGKTHYLTKIKVFCASAITVSIGGGETTSALTATFIGPLPFAATSSQYSLEFEEEAMVIGSATALCIDASGGGNVFVWAEVKTG